MRCCRSEHLAPQFLEFKVDDFVHSNHFAATARGLEVVDGIQHRHFLRCALDVSKRVDVPDHHPLRFVDRTGTTHNVLETGPKYLKSFLKRD